MEKMRPELKKLVENHLVLRMLCHDIANPLAVIFTSLSICEQSSDLAEIKQFLGKIRRAADEQKFVLQHVHNAKELLTSSRIVNESVALKDEVLSVVKLYQETLQTKQQELRLELVDPIPLVRGNKLLTSSLIIKSLLDNASRFSAKGSSIHVGLKLMGNEVKLTVADKGQGISDQQRPRLFDLESREISAGTEGDKGAGYSLALLKMYLDRCGGRVEIDSCTAAVDHGTTVNIWLPCLSS